MTLLTVFRLLNNTTVTLKILIKLKFGFQYKMTTLEYYSVHDDLNDFDNDDITKYCTHQEGG